MPYLNVPFVAPQPAERLRHPLAAARFGGTPTLLVVDTGATETLLTRHFATQLGLELAPAEPGTDHGGNAVPSWTALEAVAMTIGDFTVELNRVAVIEAAPRFDQRGIGGILCPQQLDPGSLLSLDFARGHMRLFPEPDDAGTGDENGLIAVELEPVQLSGDEASLIVANVAAGGSSVHVMFNTGTWENEIAPGTAPSPAGVGSGFGVGGAAVTTATVEAPAPALDGIHLPLAEWLAAPQPAGVSMQIGMQTLRSTRLDFSRERALLRWRIPARWLRRG